MKKFLNLIVRLRWVPLVGLLLIFVYPVGYFVLDSNPLANKAQISNADIPGVGTGVYVINLNRSKERYQYIKEYVNGLGLKSERIEAVDGALLSREVIKEKVDLESYKTYLGHLPKRGTIGCSLSHIKAWEAFVNSPLQYAVIFEDDVSFDPQQLKAAIEDLEKNSKLWDIATFEITHNGFPLTIKNLINGHHLVVYLTEVTHAGAYIINRKAAKHLLAKALPIKMPIDHYFTRAWELDIKFTGVENPRLIHQTFGESDIAKTTKLPDEKLNVMYSFKRCMYKLQSYVIRFFYNLRLYAAIHSR